MSICQICESSFCESGGQSNTMCELCRKNRGLAEGVKKIMSEVNYIQKKYELNFNDALEVVKVHSIIDNLDSMCYAINHIQEL